ncbi:MAG TPA: hypothetical protein VGI75_01360, partial [Pirellulales bacterium]
MHDFLASIANSEAWNQAGQSTTFAQDDETPTAAMPGRAATDQPVGAKEESASGGGLMHVVLMPMEAVNSLTAPSNVKVPSNFLYVRFSKPFLERYFCRQVVQTNPVNDNILGAAVSGTSQTVGATQLELANNSSQAQAKLRLTGTTTFDTVADSGPIEIFTRGTTKFSAAEGISFDGLNLVHHDDGCKASTQS